MDRRFYLVDDRDRDLLLDAIAQANDRWDWQWLSYAAMSTHIHYGHLAGQIDPDRFFRSAHTRFAQRFHRHREGQTLGPVFADRPKTCSMQSSSLPRLVAYHHRNPVAAGVVERPNQSTWTSHRAYLRLDPAPPWLDIERGLDILGFPDTAAGRQHFDEFVTEVNLDDLSQGTRLEQGAQTSGCPVVEDHEWVLLIDVARGVTRLPERERLESRKRIATRTRLLIALIATQDLGQTYAAVAARLGMTTGGLFNLIARSATRADFEGPLAEIRQQLALRT